MLGYVINLGCLKNLPATDNRGRTEWRGVDKPGQVDMLGYLINLGCVINLAT